MALQRHDSRIDWRRSLTVESNLLAGRPECFGLRQVDDVFDGYRDVLSLPYDDSSFCDQVVVQKVFRGSGVRGMAWRVMLRVLDPCSSREKGEGLDGDYCRAQLKKLGEKRTQYEELKHQYVPTAYTDTAPQTPEEDACSASTLWNNEDDEVGQQIAKDLVRLYPTGCAEFFEEPHVRVIMLHILYLWARENAQVSYRQGMHEILALVIFLLEGDSVDVSEGEVGDAEWELLRQLMAPDSLETDAFWMFEAIMSEVQNLYLIPSRSGAPEDNPMLALAARIQIDRLSTADPVLYQHLKDNNT